MLEHVGWRERRRDGGVALDIASGEVLAQGLAMPRSPRLRGWRLRVLNSGTGEVCVIVPGDGRFNPVAICAG